MNRLRSFLHSARFLLIVLPVAGVSVAVAVGCSAVGAEDEEDSNAAISHHSGYGYGSSGYGGSSGDGNYGYGNYGYGH